MEWNQSPKDDPNDTAVRVAAYWADVARSAFQRTKRFAGKDLIIGFFVGIIIEVGLDYYWKRRLASHFWNCIEILTLLSGCVFVLSFIQDFIREVRIRVSKPEA